MSATITTYKRILRKFLPIGVLWENINAVFDSLLEAFAVEAQRVHTSAELLVTESNPAKSTVLLSDYETIALADDEKPVGGETTTQRQQVVGAKMRTAYTGPSKAFWIALALKLGMTILVHDSTDSPSDDVARVDEALVDYDRVSSSGDAFRWVIEVTADPNSQLVKLQAIVGRLKPAHTTVTYI